jgi:nucleoside-diphosphate-sugar epimerase
MRILVTGASGLFGRTVARTLTQNGHVVRVMQRRPSCLDCDEILGSVTDAHTVERATEGQDAVVHLAALVSPTGPWRDFREVNIGGTQNVLDASRKAGVERLVYVSSPAVAHAGPAQVGTAALPADPATTKSHYARSKAMAEQLVLNRRRGEMLVAAVRPHLVWGPGDEQLVRRIVERAAQGTLRLVGSGAALIDSTYVDNAADAIAASVERADVIDGRALVVSNGEPRTVAELIRSLCHAAGLPEPTGRVPRWTAKAAGSTIEAIWAMARITKDPPMTRFLAEQLSTAHWYDQRETQRLLDWTPRVSIAEGLERLARSY